MYDTADRHITLYHAAGGLLGTFDDVLGAWAAIDAADLREQERRERSCSSST